MNAFSVWSAVVLAPFIATFGALIVVEVGVGILRLAGRSADLDTSGDVL